MTDYDIPRKAKQCVGCGALALERETVCTACGGPLVRFDEVDA